MKRLALLAALAAALPCATLPLPARADNSYLLAGGEAARKNYYTYLGVVMPGPGWRDGKGLLQRYWVDGYGYEYDGAPGRVKASAMGAEAALGYGTSWEGGWVAAYLGARYSDTHLSPDDTSARVRNDQLGAKFQLEGEVWLAKNVRANAAGSWTTSQRAYWGRVRVLYGLNERVFIGPEALAAGNPDYDSHSVGMVLAGYRLGGSKFSAAIKGGYRWQSAASSAYGGIELAQEF